MNSVTVKIKNVDLNMVYFNDLISEFEAIVGDEKVKSATAKSFTGVDDLIIVLSIGGGVIIKQLGAVLIAWIQKTKDKKIKYSDVEITGYSAKEVTDILRSIEDENR